MKCQSIVFKTRGNQTRYSNHVFPLFLVYYIHSNSPDPKKKPFNNPLQSEIKERRDLRDLTVFSIDPPNCQDIDGK